MNTALGPYALGLACALLAAAFAYAMDRHARLLKAWPFLFWGLLFLLVAGAVVYRKGTFTNPASHVIDTSLIINCLWNSAQGSFWWSDLSGMSILGLHSYYNVLLLLPAYAALPSGNLLAYVQPLYTLGAAAILFGLARRIMQSVAAAAVAGLLFLLFPPIYGWTHGAIHPGNLAVPLLFSALWALEVGRPRLFLLLGFLAAGSWEASLLGAPFFAVSVMIIRPAHRRTASILFAGTIALALVHFLFLQPLLMKGLPHVSVTRHFSALGANAPEIIRNVIARPELLSDVVLIRGKIGYLAQLIMPWFGISLLAPTALLGAVPELAVILLSNPGGDLYRVDCFYSQMTTVCLAWGMVLGLERMRRILSLRLWSSLTVLLVVFGIGLQFAYHHTLLPLLPRLSANLTSGSPWTQPVLDVPPGARVLVTHGGMADLLPTHRVVFPDSFMAPVARRNLLDGKWIPEYVVALPEEIEAGEEMLDLVRGRYILEKISEDSDLAIYRVHSEAPVNQP